MKKPDLPSRQRKIAQPRAKALPINMYEGKLESTNQLEDLLAFDRNVLNKDLMRFSADTIIGTDEVGRGCLAGPVVACAVVLPEILPDTALFHSLLKLNDSKSISAEVRAKLSAKLKQVCHYAIAQASVEEIDEINILHASLLAMKRAVRRLRVEGLSVILVDGNKQITGIKNIPQITVIDGDAKSASIAAASIIAKVHRDAFMCKLAKKYPAYRWESNKGYRSPDHYAALQSFGMTVWHRKSFNCGINRIDPNDSSAPNQQLTIRLGTSNGLTEE